eukprot:XP_002260056.1 [Plasmodium knowlesi strain H]
MLGHSKRERKIVPAFLTLHFLTLSFFSFLGRIQRGLEKLRSAFSTDLTGFQQLLSICNTEAGKTSNFTYQTHQSVLCNYITSSVRGTYGNSPNRGSGSGPGGTVYSGLDRTHRCKFLRICMKYLMHYSCISESDVKEILRAMEPQVRSWKVEGDVKNKQKYKEAFGRCLGRSWSEEKSKEKGLKCSVIAVIKATDRGSPSKLNPLKSALAALSRPLGGSGTCSTASNNQYVNDCSGGAPTTATQSNGLVDSDDDSDEEDDDDDDDTIITTTTTTTTTTTASSTQSPSLPGWNGKGKKGNLPFPSLSSFPFDSIHPYLPLVPSIIGIITITYFLWKVRKKKTKRKGEERQ